MRALVAGLVLGCTAGCAVTPYQPLPVEVPGGLPADAWQRVRGLLLSRYGALAVSDPEGFRLQTPWLATEAGDLPAEQRATVFREAGDRLGVVVELRYLTLPTLGTPAWTSPRGDPSRERALADALEAELRDYGSG